MRNWMTTILLIAGMAGSGNVAAQENEAPDVWQIPFGTSAETLDTFNLIDPSCGTNGGPPSLPLSSFTEFENCPLSEDGFYEIWFRYDDTLENMARALRNPIQIGRHLATAIAGHPVIVSLLLDEDGQVRGYRVFTDSRAPENQRQQAYALSANLKAVLSTGWDCTDLPAAEGEEAIQRVFVKQDCALDTDRVSAELRSRYLFKPGQHIVDPATGKPTTNIFESTTTMEVTQNQPYVDELDRDVVDVAEDNATNAAFTGETPEALFLSGRSVDCPGCALEGADLRRRDLTGANLSGANLVRATFHRAILRQADLSGATLTKANFNLAELSLTNFAGADLTEAMLFHARGTRTDFSNAILDKAKMGEIGLRQAIFASASLLGTDLGSADLNRADFTDAVLNGSYLYQGSFLGTDFSGAEMTAANLDSALLREVNLTGANLTDSDLQNADLRGADLSDANFTHVRLASANLRETIQRGTDFTDALMPR